MAADFKACLRCWKTALYKVQKHTQTFIQEKGKGRTVLFCYLDNPALYPPHRTADHTVDPPPSLASTFSPITGLRTDTV